jgi:N-acetylmuramoyl-L-alanine amidase/putative methionine-R-sulfoxide reductase with GAF domain
MVLPQEFATTPMSVTPANPPLESIPGISSFDAGPQTPPGDDGRRSALEALLAFAALHQQTRSRSYREDSPTQEDSRRLEQFVLDEVLQLVAERAQAITGADGIAIALAEHNAIVCRASTGKIAPDHGVGVDPNSGFSGACLASGEIVRCDDTEADPRVDAYACRRLGARAMVAVPLCARRTVIGLVEAFSSEPFGFNDSDVRSLSLLSELILAALRPEEEDRFAEASRQIVGRPEDQPIPLEPPATRELVESKNGDDNSNPSDGSSSLAQNTLIAKTRPGLGVVIAVVLCALILGAGLWWKMRTSQSRVAVQGAARPPAQPIVPATQVAAQPAANDSELSEEESPVTPANPSQLSKLPEVTGIRHWSSPNSSSVVIDLEDQVQYEAHRLTNPERIYFDLHETRLASDLFGKSFEVEDPLIQRVRVAQPVPGITRIVLETKGASNFSVSLEINPYRLVVEVRKIGSKPEAMTKFDQFVPIEQASTAPTPAHAVLPKLRIALDAGHGGWDLGTVGRQGLLEKDLALDIVSRLGKLVEHRLGAEVIYTRKDDNYLPLEERTEIANVAQADLFVSVHANYSDYASARGVETYYTNTYSSVKARLPGGENTGPALQDVDWTKVDIREKVRDSHRLAVSVQHALYNTLVQKNPGLPNRGVKEAQYVVLTGTTMPAILAEISFVSSPTDENNLQSSSYRQQVAEALCQGLEQYTKKSELIKLASASGKSTTQ